MLVKDLDNNNHNWQLTGNMSKGSLENKSSYHLKARELLIGLFPTLQILEEVPIPLRRSETLFLDFYLPLKKLCLEIHGEQHYKFVAFYHSNMLGFLKSQKRDKEKQEWCSINNIQFIELPYDESIDDWRQRIQN
jgi:hypothetical protein